MTVEDQMIDCDEHRRALQHQQRMIKILSEYYWTMSLLSAMVIGVLSIAVVVLAGALTEVALP